MYGCVIVDRGIDHPLKNDIICTGFDRQPLAMMKRIVGIFSFGHKNFDFASSV